MKRHKRRRKSGTVRCIAAVMLPVAAAAAVHGAFGIRDSFFSSKELITHTETAAAPHKADSETISRIVREDELLEGKMTLSVGYGVCDEKAENQEYLRLPDPRDTRADDAGAKPYPKSWGSDGEIIRTTYGEYSGNSFFDLEGGGQVNNKTELSNDELIIFNDMMLCRECLRR